MTHRSMTHQPQATGKAWFGVAAITASLFVFLTTELMPVGLLTPLSSSLRVPVGVAGLMVTLYGVSAGLGVPFIVAWTRRVNRRLLLSLLLVVLTLGNLVTAVAPSFPLVLTTRLVMGFASGVFWAIGVSMAMRMVPGPLAGRAAAVVMSGISIAAVVGIPLGIFVESLTGWRRTFLIWAGLSLLVLAAVAVLVPSLPSDNAVPVRAVFGLPRANAQLRLVMVMVVLFVLGHFGAYTFIRPFLEGESATTPTAVTILVMLYGIGGAAGNFLAGHVVTSNFRAGFVVGSGGVVVSLLLLLTAGHQLAAAVVAVTLWGMSFGIVQLCQLNLTQAAAPSTFEAAMSLNTMAYNTSIALGALVGGLFADHAGVRSVFWFGIALTAGSIVVTALTWPKRT
ncbi:putative MFS family arabinose efflux permease [Kribbella voronezhensis]|uniref:Putative MFS family arabinose efflux permease n=1 Tax=Kribbella voronezhensis TaxID=2512212 RepID=A0A4R7T9F1_9ACTN|nr:MFS transporter [Kribbella voronezhensis]TDU87986.1 putative MFS family arabinose efflux permease [Kribbella voronezhensis]